MPTPNIGVQQGIGNTGIENPNLFIRDVDPRMYYLEQKKYPLVSRLFTMGTRLERKDDNSYEIKGTNDFKKEVATNPRFEWDENEMLKLAFNPTAAVTTGATSITISTSDDDFFVAGDEILLVNAAGSREVARVTAVTAGSLTVTRNIGSTGAIALATSDFFYRMGVVREEDSTSTSPRQARSETMFNYVQFMSEPYGVTEIGLATANYHGNSYDRLKMEAFARMKQRMEVMFWFGVRSADQSTTNPIYHNGGIMHFLENVYTDVPVFDAGGILSKATWDGFIQEALKNGGDNKLIFCSDPVLEAVNGFATNNIRVIDQKQKEYGMKTQTYISPFGEVELIREPLFGEVANMANAAVVLDMDKVKWRYLSGNGKNLDLKSHDDIQENDRSGKKGEWKFVGGIQVATGKSHAILRNVQR